MYLYTVWVCISAYLSPTHSPTPHLTSSACSYLDLLFELLLLSLLALFYLRHKHINDYMKRLERSLVKKSRLAKTKTSLLLGVAPHFTFFFVAMVSAVGACVYMCVYIYMRVCVFVIVCAAMNGIDYSYFICLLFACSVLC